MSLGNTPLNAVNVFEVSARLGSFKKAAEELCVTPGAVSRQIKHLEDHVGKKLFKRKSKHVELTKEGKILFSKIGLSLDTLHKATHEIQTYNNKETIHIETPLTFAMHWLLPKINDFQKQNPDLELQVTTSSESVFVHRDIDLYIRRDPSQFSGLKGEDFLTEYSALVCSPSFIQKYNFEENSNICSFPLIMINSRQDLWPLWFRSEGKNINSIETPITLDNTILAIQAAIHGLGIALLPVLFLKQYLDNGSLVSIHKGKIFNTGSYYYLKSPLPGHAKANIFLDWIKEYS